MDFSTTLVLVTDCARQSERAVTRFPSKKDPAYGSLVIAAWRHRVLAVVVVVAVEIWDQVWTALMGLPLGQEGGRIVRAI